MHAWFQMLYTPVRTFIVLDVQKKTQAISQAIIIIIIINYHLACNLIL